MKELIGITLISSILIEKFIGFLEINDGRWIINCL